VRLSELCMREASLQPGSLRGASSFLRQIDSNSSAKAIQTENTGSVASGGRTDPPLLQPTATRAPQPTRGALTVTPAPSSEVNTSAVDADHDIAVQQTSTFATDSASVPTAPSERGLSSAPTVMDSDRRDCTRHVRKSEPAFHQDHRSLNLAQSQTNETSRCSLQTDSISTRTASAANHSLRDAAASSSKRANNGKQLSRTNLARGKWDTCSHRGVSRCPYRENPPAGRCIICPPRRHTRRFC
jgi:hypothetical protein